MHLDTISIGKDSHEVNVVIEAPIGGEPIKYEMDKKAGTLVVDRFLYTPMRYPGNYGFTPHTLSEDGDPLGSACRQYSADLSERGDRGSPRRRPQDRYRANEPE